MQSIMNLFQSKTTWAVAIAQVLAILAGLGLITQVEADVVKQNAELIQVAILAIVPIASRLIKPIIVAIRDYTNFQAFTVLLCAGLVLGASGCVTATPGFGGKTRSETYLKTQQPDTVDEAGNVVVRGESYEYKQNLELPAGVELTNQNQMSAGINDGGDWLITVGSDNTANTMGQANMMAEINRQQIESMQAILNMALQIAGPLVGQRLTNDAAADVLKYQDKAGQRQALMDLFKDPGVQSVILEALTAPTAQPTK